MNDKFHSVHLVQDWVLLVTEKTVVTLTLNENGAIIAKTVQRGEGDGIVDCTCKSCALRILGKAEATQTS
jgi:hypothetical protein